MNENENNLHNDENSDLNNSVDEAVENLNQNASENTECSSEAAQQSNEGMGNGNSQVIIKQLEATIRILGTETALLPRSAAAEKKLP